MDRHINNADIPACAGMTVTNCGCYFNQSLRRAPPNPAIRSIHCDHADGSTDSHHVANAIGHGKLMRPWLRARPDLMRRAASPGDN